MAVFSTNLNNRLSAYEMKRETFAKLVGASRADVDAWINGEYYPDEEQVLKIAYLFDKAPAQIQAWIDEDEKKRRGAAAYRYLINRVRDLPLDDALALYAQLKGEDEPDEKAGCPDLFYENFLALCAGVDKSPSRVAAEIGISKSAVSRWGDGGGITDASAFKVANYFGISVKALKEGVTKEED